MSSDFTPINMQNRVRTEDTAYPRQNQYGTTGKAAKSAGFTVAVPSNDDIAAGVENARQMIAKGSFPDRGSILNIVV